MEEAGANMTTARLFDLNIEKILEAWESAHAVRELIANAIDEQQLTDTPDIDVFKTEDGDLNRPGIAGGPNS